MRKINCFLILFIIAVGVNIAQQSWGQIPVYIVSTDAVVEDTIRPGKWFPVRVEISPFTDTANLCFDLNPLQGPAFTPLGTLFPNRAQLIKGEKTVLCYYEPPADNPGGFSIVIQAITSTPLGVIKGQSNNIGLYVLTGPAKEEGQIRAYPNPFGDEKLKATIGWIPPAGETRITIYPVSGRGFGEVIIKIFDSFGQLVKAFKPKEITGFNDAGRFCMRVTWDGKNEKGHKVANGVYQICVRVEEAEGPRVYTQKIGVLW